MSTIVPINIPCITKYKIGLDPDSGQLYYTSGITDYKSITIDPAVITGTIIEQLSDYIPISGLITTNDSISLINNELSLDRIVFNSYQDYSNITIGNEYSYTKYQKGGIYSRNDETQFSISSYFDEEINSNILDIQISGMGDDSFIRFNNNDQNTPNGLVVLDENGKIPTEIYNGIITNDTNLIGNGTEEQPLQLKYGKGIVSNDGLSINPNDLIFDQEFTIGNERTKIKFSGNGELQLNNSLLNQPNGLVKLDANGYIIDDCLLKLIEIDNFNEPKYQISGGTYTVFNNPISSLTLKTEYNMDNYPNFNKYGYIRFICGSEDINIEFPIQIKIIGTIPIFELNKVYLIKYLRNEFEISQITKLQLSNDYIVLPGITLTIDAGEIFNNITVSNQGTLIVNIPSIEKEVEQGSLKDLNIQSGGKLIYNIPEQYNPEKYTLLQGSNTSIASNTIYTLNGEICEGYCENGTFYNLNNTYVLGVGNGITIINPNISNSLTKLYGFNQAIINGAEIFEDGNLYIYNNCIASNTNIMNWGSMYINNGGIASNTNISYDGCMYIYNGGIASETNINIMGCMYISGGGIASNTNIIDLGHMDILSGGIASNTNISNNGYMYIDNGGIASNNIINDGYLIINDNGQGFINEINSAGYVSLKGHGIAISNTVNSKGYITIYSGGMASETVINSGGYIIVYRNGILDTTTINSGGKLYISSGGICNNINVSDGGYINSFGFITDSYLHIDSTINDNIIIGNNVSIINYSMCINNSGIINSVNVYSRGQIFVNSGGTLIDPTFIYDGNSNGELNISSGGSVTIHTNVDAIINQYGGIVQLTDGYIKSANIISSGAVINISGGSINTLNINDYGINPIITSGGSIDSVNIDKWSTSSGTVGMRNNIYLSGGTINNLNNSGRIYLYGGTVNNLYMSGDTTNLNSITIYNGAIINGGSTAKTNTFIISSGGTVTINNFNFNSSSYIFASSGLFSNCNFTRNNLNIRGNVIISNCNITDNTKVYVNRGSVDNLIINSGCSIVVSAGTANYLNIGPSALLQVNSGGTALHIKLDSNALTPIIATGAVVSYD